MWCGIVGLLFMFSPQAICITTQIKSAVPVFVSYFNDCQFKNDLLPECSNELYMSIDFRILIMPDPWQLYSICAIIFHQVKVWILRGLILPQLRTEYRN